MVRKSKGRSGSTRERLCDGYATGSSCGGGGGPAAPIPEIKSPRVSVANRRSCTFSAPSSSTRWGIMSWSTPGAHFQSSRSSLWAFLASSMSSSEGPLVPSSSGLPIFAPPCTTRPEACRHPHSDSPFGNPSDSACRKSIVLRGGHFWLCVLAFSHSPGRGQSGRLSVFGPRGAGDERRTQTHMFYLAAGIANTTDEA